MGKMILVQRWIGLVAGLAMLLLLRCPTLMSVALTNAGMLTLRDGLIAQEELVLGVYPHSNILPGDLTTTRAMRNLRWAVTLDGDSLPARWALGRAALALGNNEMAADALRFFITQAGQYSLLYSDVLTALSLGGQPEDVIAFYEIDPPLQRTQAINDAVALAYLAQRGKDALENAKKLRPGDLYVNYHLWKWTQEEGDVHVAAAYSETLTYFPLEAIDPTDERLLDYAAQVIPTLLEEGVWDREKTLNVVSYLVWQHNTAAGVMRLLENLTARYPDEPDWPFYLAELYHRRGDLDQAETVYKQVLRVDPDYAQAYLRLGMVSEEGSQRCSEEANQRLSEAAKWYEEYNALAPDDLLGLKCLTETCTALEEAGVGDKNCVAAAQRILRITKYEIRDSSDSDASSQLDPDLEPAAVLQEALAARTDDRRIVAELLDVPVEDVELGPNLVQNGGFKEWISRDWIWRELVNQDVFNKASFAGGVDRLGSLEGERAGRIDGIWIQEQNGRKPAQAGFGLFNEIKLFKRLYVLSLDYCTPGPSSQGRMTSLWLTDEAGGFWRYNYKLPVTHGKWYHFLALSEQRSTEFMIRPLLRSFTEGSFRFDNVQVYGIQYPTVPTDLEATQFFISN